MKTVRRLTLTLGLATAGLSAMAADEHTVTVSGFGTAALTKTDTNDAEFVRLNQASGASKQARTGVDSNFGIQASMPLDERFSITVQGLVHKDGSDAYRGELAWAFLKYVASDDVTFRFGRTTPSVYMISDSRNVGYANVMIRPVGEIYKAVPIGSFDGADIMYKHAFDDTVVTAQAGAGVTHYERPGSSGLDFKPLVATQLIAENGPYTFRVGYADSRFSVVDNPALDGLVAALRGTGQAAVADAMFYKDVRGRFISTGFGFDQSNFLILAEYAKKKISSRVVADTTSWYAMFGYRYQTLTPFYLHASTHQDTPRSFASQPTTGALAGLTAATNGVIRSGQQVTDAIGLRWDFARSAAFKFQIDHVTPKDGPGGFIHATPAFKGAVNVYAAGIDFVF